MTYDIVIGRSKDDKRDFGLDGTIYLGKHYVTMGSTVALSNKIYLDMIRSHVVFVAGKRGGGKCLHGDTLITLHDGSRVPIKKLKDNDKEIIALNGDLKITKATKSEFYAREVTSLLHITLRSGKEIKLTPEHPLLTIEGWKPAASLLTGSRIATPRTVPFFGEEHLEEHKIKLLAYLIAEGHMKRGLVLFSNIDPDIIADFTHAVHDIDKLLVVNKQKKGCYRIANKGFAKKNTLKELLTEEGLYGTGSLERFIPQSIFTLTKANISLFLNRLFSCDGSIHFDTNKKSWRVSYASSSHRLITDVQSLLLKFSIRGRIRKKLIRLEKKKFTSYELEVAAAHIPSFLQSIGFFGEKVAKQQRALREVPTTNNPNVDTIPQKVWEKYTPENWAKIGREMGYAHPKALRESTRYAPSRQKLAQIALLDGQEQLYALATSDIFWDEIKSVKKLKGTFEVYDITVPELHNFVANDIIVHNSYTLGVIAEGMADLPDHIKQNMSIILLDTMGIYWTMKYPNQKERELVEKWEMDVKGLDVTIFTPHGYYKKAIEEGIPTDYEFSIKPSELLGSDWTTTFGMEDSGAPSVLIERIVHDLKELDGEFSIDDILTAVEKSPDADTTTKAAVKNHFIAAKNWGLFSEDGTPLSDLAKPGQVTVVDLSAFATQEHGWEIKALVTGIISQKLFLERMTARKDEEFKQVDRDVNYLATEDDLTQKFPLVWLIIDEAHEFLPNVGKTLATDPLVTILREGRQPGISLVLASQQPGKIHTDVMTQADTVISHRITAKIDTDALGLLMQSYLRKGLDQLLDGLPRLPGAALILDDTNEKMFPIQVRPRMTWHGGEAPSAIKKEKKIFGF